VRSSDEYLEFDAKYNLGFLANPRRFNVAITRAQALLIVIANPFVLATDPTGVSFLRYCRRTTPTTGCPPPPLEAKLDDDQKLVAAPGAQDAELNRNEAQLLDALARLKLTDPNQFLLTRRRRRRPWPRRRPKQRPLPPDRCLRLLWCLRRWRRACRVALSWKTPSGGMRSNITASFHFVWAQPTTYIITSVVCHEFGSKPNKYTIHTRSLFYTLVVLYNRTKQ